MIRKYIVLVADFLIVLQTHMSVLFIIKGKVVVMTK